MIAGIKLPNYKDLIPNIFEYDVIRINKLLHMAQDAVITAMFCFFVGIGINGLYPIPENEKVSITVTMACMQMVTVIIGVYYIRKLTRLIPFFLRFSSKYNPFHKSKDGEGLVGAAIAMGLLLMSTQSNMKDRIKKLKGLITKNEDTTHLGFFAPLHVTTSGDGAGFDDV
jgi:hypothetical protein